MDLNRLLKTQWDRSAAIVCTVLGALFLIIGWFGVSGTAYLAEQAPYIMSGGVGGVFLLGLGATLWISADLRDEWRKLDRIEQALGNGMLTWSETDPLRVPSTLEGLGALPMTTIERPLGAADLVVSGNGASGGSSVKAARTASTTRRTASRPKASDA